MNMRTLYDDLFVYLALAALLLVSVPVKSQVQYIHEVLEYTPAPGQFMNKEPWGHPTSAGSIIGNINGHLSLGSFGGYVIFRFESPVLNHPNHPFGVDFIVFGNPFTNFSEPGIVSVMKDENGNGLPDDTWYELAGSDYFFSTTLKNNIVTYKNPGGESALPVPWIDNSGNSGSILVKSFHSQSYYPSVQLFPHIPAQHYQLSGTRITGFVDNSNPGVIVSARRKFGYADNTIRGKEPWNIPGNPYASQPGNAGADGFDISWAIDSDGNYVDLDMIHFIKIHTAILDDAGWLGEISAEITGAVKTIPAQTATEAIDIVVIKDVPPVVQPGIKLEAYAFTDGRIMKNRKISWSTDSPSIWIDVDNILNADEAGKTTIRAFASDNPSVFAEMQMTVQMPSNVSGFNTSDISISPNPADNYITIHGNGITEITIFDLTGRIVLWEQNILYRPVYVAHLHSGFYLVRISKKGSSVSARLTISR
jgi:hypothetical protein